MHIAPDSVVLLLLFIVAFYSRDLHYFCSIEVHMRFFQDDSFSVLCVLLLSVFSWALYASSIKRKFFVTSICSKISRSMMLQEHDGISFLPYFDRYTYPFIL